MRLLIGLMVWLLALPAVALDLTGDLEQGALVFGKVAPGTPVAFDGRPVAVDDTGRFLFGIGRDAGPAANLTVGAETVTLTIAPRDWDIQRIDGLPDNKVTPSAETLKRIRTDAARIREARSRATPVPYWRSGFVVPAEGRISGVFGSQRILNGQPRNPHSGTDFAAPTGAPILSTADGVVSLVANDMFYTGGTVMIDHGQGLASVYAHMSAIDVSEGQRVTRGQRIGAVGSTGRSTGPHLHFGLSWYQTRVDPLTVLPLTALPSRTR